MRKLDFWLVFDIDLPLSDFFHFRYTKFLHWTYLHFWVQKNVAFLKCGIYRCRFSY
jgi:hypothetical protein